MEGIEKGEVCNRNGCKSLIEEYEKEGCCYCHINPPCSYCTEPNAYCDSCGWSEKEEKEELEIINLKSINKQNDYWVQKNLKFEEDRKLFNLKYAGKIPAEKLEIRKESHTHFSMIVRAVFPSESETKESLINKLRGTFGGRFIRFNNYSCEYIAYTD